MQIHYKCDRSAAKWNPRSVFYARRTCCLLGLYGVPSADFAPQNRIICMGADVSGNSPGSPRACS
jgi:hypothetical protein